MIGPRPFIAALSLAALVACDSALTPSGPPTAESTATVSRESEALARYYSSLQADLLSRGLLRTDGGGPDTPYTDTMLAENFERIAFYDEYARGAGLQRASAGAVSLRRWPGPVRLSPEFGASVPAARPGSDLARRP